MFNILWDYFSVLPLIFTTAGASHYYTYMYALYHAFTALRHSCRSIRLQIFCPTCTIADRYRPT